MRRIRPIFLFLTLCLFTKSFSQEKNEIRIDLRVFQEDAIFKYFRKHPKNEYVYNQGVGLSIVYTRRLNKRLSTGLETGGWYFFNDAKNIDPLNYAEYRIRNTLTPIMGRLGFLVYENGLNWLAIGIRGGTAYTQNIHKFNDNTVKVMTKWTSVFEFSLSFQFITKRKKRRILAGTHYTFFDGKRMGSVALGLKYFEF